MIPMFSMGLFTVLMLPVYLALRYPFFRLPLHIDTGFYVSNHTICTRKINLSKGWNAHFAGCSKVIPELFYSLIYLLHGGTRYKFYSRLYYSLYNYGTAILIGYGAYVLGGESEILYYGGLITFCMISSEPHYGVYFESAEQFELPFQVIGFLLIVLGLEGRNPYFVAGGFGVWVLGSFFIKLSSLIGGSIFGLGIVLLCPASLPYVALAGLIGLGLYVAWVSMNGRSVLELIKPLIGHESYFEHRFRFDHYVDRAVKKTSFLYKISSAVPVVPGLAVLGAVVIGDKINPLLLYLVAVAATYFFQAAQVWYYAIPFLPPLAILAAFGAVSLSDQGVNGLAAMWLLGIVWLGVHLGQAHGRLMLRGLESLNRYAWQPHGTFMADKNLRLEEIVPVLRSHVRGRRMFVFGAWNQAYVLLDTSYDTPLVSAARWLDSVASDWQRNLNRRLLTDTPEYLLDTDDCLDVEAIRRRMGLDFRLAVAPSPQFRLFALNGSNHLEKPDLDCRSFTVP